MNLPELMAHLREESEMTVEAAAHAAGLAAFVWRKVENGERNLSPEARTRVARALDVDPDVILAAPFACTRCGVHVPCPCPPIVISCGHDGCRTHHHP